MDSIKVRSEKARQMIEEKPAFWIRWGTSIIFLLFFALVIWYIITNWEFVNNLMKCYSKNEMI